uniref:polyketide synthase n=1 Tax=Pseudoalteromonas sp. (strain SANK 73390) TaxID=747457 RepID=UPI0002117296|nr:polyketide synthase [Pseudoalteromonas sp. SANK 73390]CBK62729.1 tmpE [Pseudoalteromonas sp. SANK 73390]
MNKTIINSAVYTVENANGVVQITLEDRANKNMFTRDIIAGLMQAYKNIDENQSCKVVIITGFDSYFCSGGTQDSLLSLNDTQGNFSDVNIYSLPLECRVPVISAIQGHAIGGGLVMGLFSDIVLLSKESYYTLNFMKYGFTPGMGSTLIVPTKLGTDLGNEMLLSANQYRGDELQQRGVPLQVLLRKQVLSRAYELADLIAQKPIRSVHLLKQHLCQNICTQLPKYIEQELAMHAQTMHQPEVANNIKQLFGQPSGVSICTKSSEDNHASHGAVSNGKKTQHNEQIQQISSNEGVNVSLAGKDIAIVSMAGRFPEADSVDVFWENIKQGVDCVIDIPKDREDLFSQENDSLKCRWGGFIKDVDKFDPLFFKISPREAQLMDPQERLLLEEVWNLLEVRGYTKQTLAQQYGNKVAVYTASMYQQYHAVDTDEDKKPLVSMSSLSSMANRISHFFDFHGPSMSVDTMCSGASSAIYLACQSLLSGASRLAIVGATNLSIHAYKYQALSQSQLLAAQRQVRGFGDAGGFIPAEMVGAVLLKPLQDALRDNDDVVAVIKGVHADHKGNTDGFNVSDPHALTRLIEEGLKIAGMAPEQVDYIETSVAGASVSDCAEIEAMKRVFDDVNSSGKLPIGTVKSSIGHAEAASGLTQLIKVAMQLKHRELAPTIYHKPLNPKLMLEQSPFAIQDKFEAWATAQPHQPRRAMINTLGAGGSGCCMLLEEPPLTQRANKVARGVRDRVMMFSAKTEERLRLLITRFIEHLSSVQDIHLDDLAYTLMVGREAMPARLSCVVSNMEDLFRRLSAWLEDKEDGLIFFNDIEHSELNMAFEPDTTDVSALVKHAIHWVGGACLSWETLYPEELGSTTHQIVELPTYPFSRRHCWLPKPVVQRERTVDMASVTANQDKDKETNVQQEAVAEDINAKEPSGSSEREYFVVETVSQIIGLTHEELNITTPLKALGVSSITKMLIVSAICDGIEQLDEVQVGSELIKAATVADIIRIVNHSKTASTTIDELTEKKKAGDFACSNANGCDFTHDNSPEQMLECLDEQSIVVIGAGPAGIMAALSAMHCGAQKVYLFERRKKIDRTQMVTIYQNALPYLKSFGVLEQVIARGTPIKEHSFFYTASNNESTRYYHKEIDKKQLDVECMSALSLANISADKEFVGESVLAISLADLQDVLLIEARHRGIHIYFDVDAQVVPQTESDRDAVTLSSAELSLNRSVFPKLIILADGKCSKNAQTVGVRYHTEAPYKDNECWYTYRCRVKGCEPTLSYKFSFDDDFQLSGCEFGLFYPKHDELSVAVFSANGKVPVESELEKRAEFFCQAQQQDIDRVLWVSQPINVQYTRADIYICKNVILTGDAAGTGSPVAGMGVAISAYASALEEYFKLSMTDKQAAEKTYNNRLCSCVDAWLGCSRDIWSKIDKLPNLHQSEKRAEALQKELETPL